MHVLLTSCGLETPAITDQFLRMLPKAPEDIRAIFIPTAANTPDAIEVLPKCLNDLLKCGIQRDNILVYDLHQPMSEECCCSYDVVYLCGGSPSYLMQRLHEAGFDQTIRAFIQQGGVVLGVSAGSIIFAGHGADSLGYMTCPLRVHCSDDARELPGTSSRQRREEIRLGNRQGLCLTEESILVFE